MPIKAIEYAFLYKQVGTNMHLDEKGDCIKTETAPEKWLPPVLRPYDKPCIGVILSVCMVSRHHWREELQICNDHPEQSIE
jgi:hypothetical protein